MDRGDLNGTHEGSGAGNEKFAKSLRDSFKGDNRPKVVKKNERVVIETSNRIS
jgi:hypothetical protein